MVLTVISYRKLTLEKNSLYLLLWILFGFVSLIYSSNVSKGFDYLLAAGNMVIIIILVCSINWTMHEFLSLLKYYAFSALSFAIILIVQQGGYRGSSLRFTVTILGVEYDPNVIVAFLIPASLIFIALFIWKEIKGFIAIPSFIVMIYASFLANSRGGFVALAFSIISLFVVAFFKGRIAKQYIKYFILMLCVCSILVWLISQYVNPYLISRIIKIDFVEGSSVNRISLLIAGWISFLNHPFIGIGVGGADALTGQAMHNMYMLILVDSGLLGFCLYIIPMVNIWIKLNQSEKWELSVVFISMFVVVFFLDSYHAKYLWNIVAFSMIYNRINQVKLRGNAN